jgi:hypothetical protein
MNRQLRKIPGIIVLFIGILFLLIGLDGTQRALRLRSGAKVTTATVDEMREGRLKDTYELRYHFSLPGGAIVYRPADATGRTNLWRSVPYEEGLNARTTKVIEVAFDPSNPWINRPAAVAGFPMGDSLASLILGVVGLGYGTWVLIRLSRTNDRHSCTVVGLTKKGT